MAAWCSRRAGMQSQKTLPLLALGPRSSFLITLSLHLSVPRPDFMGGVLEKLWWQWFWENPCKLWSTVPISLGGRPCSNTSSALLHPLSWGRKQFVSNCTCLLFINWETFFSQMGSSFLRVKSDWLCPFFLLLHSSERVCVRSLPFTGPNFACLILKWALRDFFFFGREVTLYWAFECLENGHFISQRDGQ